MCRFNRSRKFYPISRLNNFFPTLNNLLKKGNIQIYKPSCLILSKNLHLMKNSFLILIKFNLHSNPKTIPRSSLSEKKILQKTLLSTKSLSSVREKCIDLEKYITSVTFIVPSIFSLLFPSPLYTSSRTYKIALILSS